MPAQVLRLREVGVRRDHSMLLRDVSWTVHDGESWVIVGPNGAGKTTLLQIASGLVLPSEGSAEVLGEPLELADLADLRSRVGIASAAVADQVPRREKVIDLVMTAGYGTIGRDSEEFDSFDVARAVELLDALGCAHLIRRKFGSLSEGERKRVQIARSLMADPELLLLDEPAAGLDLGGREDLLARITALLRDPRSPILIMVTHHVEEVPEGFTHAMLMRAGFVLAAGPIADVFTEANLSRCFGVPLIVERRASRWMARAVPPPLTRRE
jgi:iron complex transport system ATP-binding protein